nr:derlin-1 [Quercus suber]
MAAPAEYYRSLPPVSKFYGVACLITTSALYLDLYNPYNIALIYGLVLKRFQVWRLITNFFFLGPFSVSFGFRLLLIARYGVSLERGPFDKRTADYVWMFVFGALSLLVMAAVPYLWSPFMGGSLVFMLVYVWSREFPNAQINIYGLVSLKCSVIHLPELHSEEEATVSTEMDQALQSRQRRIVLHRNSSPTRVMELLSEAEAIVLTAVRGLLISILGSTKR